MSPEGSPGGRPSDGGSHPAARTPSKYGVPDWPAIWYIEHEIVIRYKGVGGDGPRQGGRFPLGERSSDRSVVRSESRHWGRRGRTRLQRSTYEGKEARGSRAAKRLQSRSHTASVPCRRQASDSPLRSGGEGLCPPSPGNRPRWARSPPAAGGRGRGSDRRRPGRANSSSMRRRAAAPRRRARPRIVEDPDQGGRPGRGVAGGDEQAGRGRRRAGRCCRRCARPGRAGRWPSPRAASCSSPRPRWAGRRRRPRGGARRGRRPAPAKWTRSATPRARACAGQPVAVRAVADQDQAGPGPSRRPPARRRGAGRGSSGGGAGR